METVLDETGFWTDLTQLLHIPVLHPQPPAKTPLQSWFPPLFAGGMILGLPNVAKMPILYFKLGHKNQSSDRISRTLEPSATQRRFWWDPVVLRTRDEKVPLSVLITYTCLKHFP